MYAEFSSCAPPSFHPLVNRETYKDAPHPSPRVGLKYLCRYVVWAGRRAGKRRPRQYHVASGENARSSSHETSCTATWIRRCVTAGSYALLGRLYRNIGPRARYDGIIHRAVLKAVRLTQDPRIFLRWSLKIYWWLKDCLDPWDSSKRFLR